MTYLVTMGTLLCQMERPGRNTRRKLLTTDDLEQAMVMVGDGASLRKASSTFTYKVPVDTLRMRISFLICSYK